MTVQSKIVFVHGKEQIWRVRLGHCVVFLLKNGSGDYSLCGSGGARLELLDGE